MNIEELTKIVMDIISQEAKINVDQIGRDVVLADLDIDSLDILKIASALEKRFKITITTTELEQIKTFGDVIQNLENKNNLKDL